VIFTTSVDPTDLADGWPWLIQELIVAAYDLTVVYVHGVCFGFTLERAQLPGLDWRMSIGTELADTQWQMVSLPTELTAAIHAYMNELQLHFGRLDFLARDSLCQDVTFLEVNPNGQWAWLDLDGRHGVLDAVVRWIAGSNAETH
jgi:hypothetical protein